MSEELWRATDDAHDLLSLVAAFSQRKLRLLSCACMRRLLTFVDGRSIIQFLTAAERSADGEPLKNPVWQDTNSGGEYDSRLLQELGVIRGVIEHTLYGPAYEAAEWAIHVLITHDGATGHADAAFRTALVREVFGNPFRPLDFAPWGTDTAVALARTMYKSREFGAMPILADALQDAGCDNDEVLRHCRDTTQLHVRGCWVVDGVLGLA